MAEMTEQEELQVFQLITAAGSAKSTFMEALYKAKEGKYDEAENLFKAADGYFVEGHHAHAAGTCRGSANKRRADQDDG